VTDVANDGAHGLELAIARSYDVIVLDIMLPKLSGTEVLEGIRRNNRRVPIMMLTAKDGLSDKIRHLDSGADDYLTKPFSSAELLVRIRALLRRAPTMQEDLIKVADLEVDRLSKQVRRGGKRIDLSAKEYMLLEYLAANAGRVLSRAMILENVWGQSFDGLTNVVEVYIRYLRNKIDKGYDKKLIRNMRGVGYILGDEEA
jgi:two-component system copper resistance phosphate regulon response regulator CusR